MSNWPRNPGLCYFGDFKNGSILVYSVVLPLARNTYNNIMMLLRKPKYMPWKNYDPSNGNMLSQHQWPKLQPNTTYEFVYCTTSGENTGMPAPPRLELDDELLRCGQACVDDWSSGRLQTKKSPEEVAVCVQKLKSIIFHWERRLARANCSGGTLTNPPF